MTTRNDPFLAFSEPCHVFYEFVIYVPIFIYVRKLKWEVLDEAHKLYIVARVLFEDTRVSSGIAIAANLTYTFSGHLIEVCKKWAYIQCNFRLFNITLYCLEAFFRFMYWQCNECHGNTYSNAYLSLQFTCIDKQNEAKHGSPFIFRIEGRVWVWVNQLIPVRLLSGEQHKEPWRSKRLVPFGGKRSFFSLTYHHTSRVSVWTCAMLLLSVISFYIYSWLSCDACLLGVFGLFFSFMNNY